MTKYAVHLLTGATTNSGRDAIWVRSRHCGRLKTSVQWERDAKPRVWSA
jgi:hypothetical protein